MEASIDLLIVQQVLVEESNALSRCPQSRWVPHLFVVQMSDKLVSIDSQPIQVGLELAGSQMEDLEETNEKLILIGDHLSAVMLSSLVAKQLAIFQHADVQKIAVGVDQKLLMGDEPVVPSAL